MRLNGVSATRRKRVNPAAVATSRRRCSPACAPRGGGGRSGGQRLVEPELVADDHGGRKPGGAEVVDEPIQQLVQLCRVDRHLPASLPVSGRLGGQCGLVRRGTTPAGTSPGTSTCAARPPGGDLGAGGKPQPLADPFHMPLG